MGSPPSPVDVRCRVQGGRMIFGPTFFDELTQITGRGISNRDLRPVASSEGEGCSRQRKGRSHIDPDMTCKS